MVQKVFHESASIKSNERTGGWFECQHELCFFSMYAKNYTNLHFFQLSDSNSSFECFETYWCCRLWTFPPCSVLTVNKKCRRTEKFFVEWAQKRLIERTTIYFHKETHCWQKNLTETLWEVLKPVVLKNYEFRNWKYKKIICTFSHFWPIKIPI